MVRAVEPETFTVRDHHAVWGGRTLREWADVLVETLVAEFNPVRILLFGSVAAGSDGPDSDIDLLVVLDDAPIEERRRLMFEMRKATRDVAAPHDLLVTSAADLARNSTRPGTTEFEPAQHGLAVYERAAA
jgi:predicted nucleotidyltransferase